MPVVYDYLMEGKILNHVQNQHLGVTIVSDLNWQHNIERIVSKASRTLGFIKQNLKHCLQEIEIQACKTLVHLILEYSYIVWDPYKINQIESIEEVQRRLLEYDDYIDIWK